jgi:hypothetical protein
LPFRAPPTTRTMALSWAKFNCKGRTAVCAADGRHQASSNEQRARTGSNPLLDPRLRLHATGRHRVAEPSIMASVVTQLEGQRMARHCLEWHRSGALVRCAAAGRRNRSRNLRCMAWRITFVSPTKIIFPSCAPRRPGTATAPVVPRARPPRDPIPSCNRCSWLLPISGRPRLATSTA